MKVAIAEPTESMYSRKQANCIRYVCTELKKLQSFVYRIEVVLVLAPHAYMQPQRARTAKPGGHLPTIIPQSGQFLSGSANHMA